MQNVQCMMHDIIVFINTPVFVRPHENDLRFWFVARKRRLRVDGMLKRRKEISVQNYPDTYERGLNVASANIQGKMQKFKGGKSWKFCVFLHNSTRAVTNLVPRDFSFCRHIGNKW